MPPAAWKRCWAPRGTCTFASPTFQHWQPLDWGQTWWVLSSLNRPLDFCYKYSSCWDCLPFILITYSGARSRTRVSSYISKWLVHFCSSLVEQQHPVRTYLVLLTYPKNCFACQLWTICPSKKYVYYVSRIYTGQLYKMHFLTCVVYSRVCVCAGVILGPAKRTTLHPYNYEQLGQPYNRAKFCTCCCQCQNDQNFVYEQICVLSLQIDMWVTLSIWFCCYIPIHNLLLWSPCLTPIQLEKKVDVGILVKLI